MPTPEQFESAMRRAGVNGSTRVVVYDDAGASVAARLWFLLGYYGHRGRPCSTVESAPGVDRSRPQPTALRRATSWRAPDPTQVVLDFEAVRRLRGCL
jgi:hypothetical protein